MNVQIQSVRFDADKKLISFVEAKVKKLERFADNIALADVTLKLDKDESAGNKVAHIRLSLPGNDPFAESRSTTFEEAVDLSVEALKKQIEKHKARK